MPRTLEQVTQVLLPTEERDKHGLAHSMKALAHSQRGLFSEQALYLLAAVRPDIGSTNLILTL